jgi:zinc transport system substrate-binding protein
MHVFRAAILINIFIFAFIQPAIASNRLPVFVSIVPQKYFVQQIGKGLVDVKVMVQPGASPATYEPKPRQMSDLSKAVVYFAIGVPFEKTWLRKITDANPEIKVIHTDHGIEKIPMAEHHHETDEHREKRTHEEDHHDHAGLDPHIWLSPPLVKIQARTILAALQEADPGNQSLYAANFRKFAARIDQLDADLKIFFTGKAGLQFMVFHPSWGYFAHAYGLKQVAIEIEGKSPKPAQLKELIEHAREKGIRVIFVQPQFSTKSAELIAREINGQVAFADPLAEDWIANLNHVADNFKEALK